MTNFDDLAAQVKANNVASGAGSRIALVKLGGFSHVNDHLAHQLARLYPNHPLDIIDVKDVIVHPSSLFVNSLFILKDYGARGAFGKAVFRRSFFTTAYAFRLLKKRIATLVSPRTHRFSIQTQSLFDASVQGLPHFVYTDHTALANRRYRWRDARRPKRADSWLELEKTIYQNATLHLTTSQFTRRSLLEDYACAPEKVVCVYSGINAEPSASASDRTYNSKNILFVGSEWQRKGGPELIKAFELVLNEHPDARLTLIGPCPKIDLPNCELVGSVPLEKLPEYYRNAAVLCLPSWIEPAAVALVEAAGHGLPVVATRVGGTPDRVIDGATGFLVEAGDVEGLARALGQLIGDPVLCRQLGHAGRRLVMETFTWPKVGDAIKQAIDPHISAG